MATDGLFYVLNVIAGSLRKILPSPCLGNIALPAGDILDDRLCVLQADRERKLIGLLSVQLVDGADGNLVKIAENIQLCQGNVGRALTSTP